MFRFIPINDEHKIWPIKKKEFVISCSNFKTPLTEYHSVKIYSELTKDLNILIITWIV